MTRTLLTRTDFLAALEFDGDPLDDWNRLGLLRPVAGQGVEALYPQEALETARQIQMLLEAGYDLPTIQKIARKVGLPSSGEGRRRGSRDRLITVGELAERTALNPRTLRYWEERGIILPDGRSTGGFRLYSEETVTICQLVKDLQLFGYSLEEIKTGADLVRSFYGLDGAAEGASGAPKLEQLDELLNQIALLEERMALLKQGIRRWEELFRKRKKELHRLREKAVKAGS